MGKVKLKIGNILSLFTIAFDKVAGIIFKDKDGIQIMKDYMEAGFFTKFQIMFYSSAEDAVFKALGVQ